MTTPTLPPKEVNKIILDTCANEGCEETFEKKTHNQIYHNDECCRQATNRRIMEKYYATRDRKQGKARMCKQCNSAKLSRYNETDTCSSCTMKIEKKRNDSVISMLFNSAISA